MGGRGSLESGRIRVALVYLVIILLLSFDVVLLEKTARTGFAAFARYEL